MPFVEVDPSQIQFDAPTAQQGFVEVDPRQIKFDAPKRNIIQQIGESPLGESIGGSIQKTAGIIRNIPNAHPISSGVQIIGQGVDIASAPIAAGLQGAYGLLPESARGAIQQNVSDIADSISSGYQSGVNKLAETGFGKAIGKYGMESPQLQKNAQELADTAKAAAKIAGAAYGLPKAAESSKVIGKTISKIEDASKTAPSLIGATESGVSTAAALGGVPVAAKSAIKGAATRVSGIKALGEEALDDLVSASDDITSNLYKAVDASGASIKPAALNQMNNRILSTIDSLQINPAASPKTIGAVKALYDRITVGKINPITGQVTQAPLTVSELDGFRKLLKSVSGEDMVAANAVRGVIDDSLQNMTHADFTGGGVQAAKTLFEARKNASKTFKLEQIADVIKKAKGDQRAIKSGFIKLTNKKGWERGFTPSEIDAIKEAAKTGAGEAVERGLGTFGFDLGRTKNFALPVIAGSSAGLGVPGGAPLVAIGTAARHTGKLAARGKAQNVINEISKRQQKTSTIGAIINAPTQGIVYDSFSHSPVFSVL